MKLCLDEHYSPQIANELRALGHDVDCVKERPELVSLSDRELWNRMQQEQRTLLTENVGDFMPLVTEAVEAQESHTGIVFSSPHSMPRGKETIGLFVQSIDKHMRLHSGENDFRDGVAWLKP